jgi:hypothetical protein
MGVRGRVLDEGEQDGDDGIKDDGGHEDREIDSVGEDGCWINGSDSMIKLRSSER